MDSCAIQWLVIGLVFSRLGAVRPRMGMDAFSATSDLEGQKKAIWICHCLRGRTGVLVSESEMALGGQWAWSHGDGCVFGSLLWSLG